MSEAQSFPGNRVVLCSPIELITNYYFIILEMLQQKFTYSDIEIQLEGIYTGDLMTVDLKMA